MSQGKNKLNTALPATALFALMLLCVLGLSAFGAETYRALTAAHNADNARRSTLSYLCVRLRAADEADGVSLAAGPEGDALILAEPLSGSGYATRLYLYEGYLVEDYAPEGSAFDPAHAQKIAEAGVFGVRKEGALLTLTTEQGTAQVYLHSEEASA